MAFKKDYRVITAATTATLYTVPIGSEASAPTLTLTAAGAATATITIFDNAAGAAVDVITGLALTASEPWSLPKPLMLNSQDEVRVTATGADVGSVLGVYEDSPAGQAVIFDPRGAYSAGATYDKGDVVENAGSTYICLTDDTSGDAPPSVHWMLLAEKGDAGPMDPVVYDPQLISGDAFARANHTGSQKIATISDAGTAAAKDVGYFATTAQGDLADTSVQPGDNISDLTNDAGYTTNSGDITSVTAGTGLSGGGMSGGVTVNVDEASQAQVRALTNSALPLTTRRVRDASALIAPSGSSNWTPDWEAFVSADWNVTANRTINNPTNVIPGTTRVVKIRASTSTERTISWGSNYKGNIPTATVTNAAFLFVTLTAISATEIIVSHLEYS